MPLADANGVQIAYRDEGQGDVVTLVHGFGSNKDVNWVETGWVRHLIHAGFRVIAIDHRGHGESEKFYDESDYSIEILAHDLRNTLVALGINRTHLVGYSMGGRTSLRFCEMFPEMVRRAAIGGAGDAVLKERSGWTDVADALRADSLADAKTARAQAFRAFADRTNSDRMALAACVLGTLNPIEQSQIEAIAAPVLVSVGTRDDVAGDPHALAALLQNGEVLVQPDKDHMSAVGDRNWKQEVVDFFGG